MLFPFEQKWNVTGLVAEKDTDTLSTSVVSTHVVCCAAAIHPIDEDLSMGTPEDWAPGGSCVCFARTYPD